MSPADLTRNILHYCRLCQKKIGVWKYTGDADFINKIYECLNIRVDDEDMSILPQSVCKECEINIDNFFKFIQDVRKVDESLRKCIEKSREHKNSVCSISDKDGKFSGQNGNVNKKFKCSLCPKSYTRLNNLTNHKKKHFNSTCSDCGSLLADSCSLKCCACDNYKHNELVDAEKCLVEEEFNNSAANEINKSENVSIVDGDSVFNVHGNSLEENDSRSSKELFRCSFCDESFYWKTDLDEHEKTHKNVFVCTWENCKKICTTAYTFKIHNMKHEGKRPFLCMTCGKGFITKNSLNCHEKIHLEIKQYVCKLCNIAFSVRSNLRAHEKKHHEGVRFYCSKCTRAFITKSSLVRHERLHTGVKEFQCSSCPSAFYTSKELAKHQRYHQGLKQYKCDECFKTFFERHHLIIHVRSHTGERPYACKIPGCEKSFTESQKLTRHLKSRHPTI